MHLGLIEQHSHEHIVYYLAAAATHAGHDVTAFVGPQIDRRVADGFGWPDAATVTVNDTLPETAAAAEAADLDVAMVVTVTGDRPDYEALAAFAPGCPFLVWIQGVETWLGDQPVEITGNTVNVTVEEGWAIAAGYRQVIMRRSAGLIVESSAWIEPAAERDPPVPVYNWPAVIARDDLGDEDSEPPLTVAVPGAIRRRRDYGQLTSAFNALYEQGSAIELRIPGRPIGDYGEKVLEWVEWASEQGRPVAFTGDREYLPFDAYNAEIDRADLILNPLVEEKNQRGFTERLGHTAGSGLIFDAIRHGTPLMLPEYVPAPEAGGVVNYDGTAGGLSRALRRLNEDEARLVGLTRDARENATAYALAPQAGRLDAILTDVTG